MARVPKTTGQGISRLSYQRGRALAGGTPAIKAQAAPVALGSSGRNYAKKAPKISAGPPISAGFGPTLGIDDINSLGDPDLGKPAKGWKQNLNSSKLKVP
jgi:hypothetical protein